MSYKSEKKINDSSSTSGLMALMIVIGAIFLMVIMVEFGGESLWAPVIIMFLLFGCGMYIMVMSKNGDKGTRKIYNEEFLTEFLPECFDYAYYEPHSGFSMQELAGAKVVNTSKGISSYDMLTGEQDGNSFRVAGVSTPGGFKGYIVEIYYIFDEAVDILCFSPDFRCRPYGFESGLDAFRLDNQRVNMMYDVYTANKETAQRFLTKEVTDELLALYDMFGDLAVRFAKDKIYVAVNSGKESPFWIENFSLFSAEEVTEKIVDQILRILDITKCL